MLARQLTCLLLCLTCSCSAVSESLRLVTGDDYAPFVGRALPAGGMLTQVVHAVLANGNVDSTLDWQPWNRAYLKTLRGEYDATFPFVPSPQRLKEYFYSAPLFIIEHHIFSRGDDPIETPTPEILKGRSVCIPLGWQPPALIQDFLDQGVLSRHSPIGIKECARLVLIGRDDFFVADRRIGETALQLNEASFGQVHRSIEPISTSSLHFIVPRNHSRGSALIEMFDAGLASLKVSGEYQQVLTGYIESRGLTPDATSSDIQPAAALRAH